MKIILTCFALLFLYSCHSDYETYNDQMDGMYACHERSNHDSTSVYDALVGTYDWRYVQVAMSSYESIEDYKGWVFNLDLDGSFELNQNDTNTVMGLWFIEKNWTSFQMNTQPIMESIWGEVILCNPYLMFMNSPVDGPDHLYEKR